MALPLSACRDFARSVHCSLRQAGITCCDSSRTTTTPGRRYKSVLTKILVEWRDMFTPPHPFDPPHLEQQYLADHCQRFAGQRRAMIFLGALSWVGFLIWDWIHAQHHAQILDALPALVGLRVGGFMMLMAAGLVALRPWFEQNERQATLLLTSGNLLLALDAYVMMLLVPLDHAFRFYYFGLVISMVFGFGMLRLRAVTILRMMVVYCVAGMLMLRFQVAWDAPADTTHAMVSVWKLSNILICIGIMGAAFGIQLERAQRAGFLRESELARSNQAITAQSREVEFFNASIRRAGEVAEERSRALMALKDQMREDAEQRNQEKSQFLANAVHDLKQPLQAVGHALEPAHHHLLAGDTTQAQAMIALAQLATERMRGLLNDILEISRLESGYVRAELDHVNLLDLVRDALAQLADEGRRQQVRLAMVAPELDQIVVYSDRHFLTRILLNLVGNGIKYRDPSRVDAWVRVTIQLRASAVALIVEDNGVGIDPRHLERGQIFRPFYQAGPHRGRGESGVGLGLSIVSAMLALMPDHAIHPRSTVGQGTTMHLDLPYGDEAALIPAPHDLPEAGAGSLRGLYVLLVEDDDLVRRSTAALLSTHGVLHEAAASVEELAALLPKLERVPDLVLTDLQWPEPWNVQTLMGLVNHHFGPVPCVVMTGDKVAVDQLTTLRVSAMLLKPVSTSALLGAIAQAAGATGPRVAPEPGSRGATPR